MSARFYTIALSHPGLAIRAALDRKGIEYETVDLLPGLHPIAVRGLGFADSTVPALKIDGRRVQGSLPIIRYLERTRAEPALYPSEPEARSAVEEAERWGEEVLQPIPRRIFRFIASRNQVVRRWVAEEVVEMPAPGLVAALNKPIAHTLGRRAGVTEQRIRADLSGLPARLARVEELIADGTLGGPAPNAADLQIFSSVLSLESLTDLAPLFAGSELADVARRYVEAPPGPVPPALDATWIPRAQAKA